MTKADIVSRIAEQTGIEKGIVTSVVEDSWSSSGTP